MNDQGMDERSIGETSYEIIGVYRITPTMENILKAVRHHGYDSMIDENGHFKNEIYWADFRDLALIELQISGVFHEGDLLKIYQHDQAPYMEYYLDPAGKALVLLQEAEVMDGRRVCFFLHLVEITLPLMVKGKPCPLPAFSELPERLVAFTHFIPAD